MNSIAETAIIFSNVQLGDNIVVEDYCVIGKDSSRSQQIETIIGDNAIIRAGTMIYAGNVIGNNFNTGNKANIREDNIIGDNVSIGTLSVIEHNVKISDGVRIHSQAFVPEYTIIEENAWLGPNVVLTNAKFPRHPDVKSELKGPIISKNVKIGANSTVLPSIIIGENSLVGAGSVVTKDVNKNVIVAGNPAKTLREIDY